ncbi:hypothetical protein [Streptomyces sp. NPDC004579]|uniref:hypothetical protein n=1 Tax=Streptomyces sp. NPDC004579 TaxID=3154667 RepID=UPI0033B042EA
MSRQTTAARRSRRLAVLVVGVSAALTLAACTTGPDASTTTGSHASAPARPAPRGVVTAKEAAAILDAYQVSNNRANARRDARLLARVEGGQVHLQSRADYEQFPTWSKKEQAYYGSPFRYTNRTYLVPRAGSATWFAVRAQSTGSKDHALLIFDKVGGTYKMVMGLYTDPKTPMPEVAVDRHGLAAAVDPSKPVGPLAPAQLGTAFEDLSETGGTKSGSKLAKTTLTKEALALYTGRDKRDDSKFDTHRFFTKPPTHPTVYALRLAGGGVLVAFPSAHTLETMLRPAYMSSFKLNPNKEESIYNAEKRVVITDEFQGQALAVLSPSGPARVIAREYRMVDSR